MIIILQTFVGTFDGLDSSLNAGVVYTFGFCKIFVILKSIAKTNKQKNFLNSVLFSSERNDTMSFIFFFHQCTLNMEGGKSVRLGYCYIIACSCQSRLPGSKESACQSGTRNTGSVPGLGRSPELGTTIHPSILAWKIPWTEEPGGLQSMGSQRVN